MGNREVDDTGGIAVRDVTIGNARDGGTPIVQNGVWLQPYKPLSPKEEKERRRQEAQERWYRQKRREWLRQLIHWNLHGSGYSLYQYNPDRPQAIFDGLGRFCAMACEDFHDPKRKLAGTVIYDIENDGHFELFSEMAGIQLDANRNVIHPAGGYPRTWRM